MLVLLGYGALVLATVLWVPASSRAKNQIGASVLVLDGDLVVGRQFVVHNESRSHWKAVTFEIDGGYAVSRELVRAGEKVTLYVRDFRKKVVRLRRGREIPRTVSAPIDKELGSLKITCSEGEAVTPLAALAAGKPGELSP